MAHSRATVRAILQAYAQIRDLPPVTISSSRQGLHRQAKIARSPAGKRSQRFAYVTVVVENEPQR